MSKNKKMSKAGAIRAVAKADLSMSNAQVRHLVQQEYGYQVSSSEIINQLGAYKDRQHLGRSTSRVAALANEFVAKVGSVKDAVRLIHLSQAK